MKREEDKTISCRSHGIVSKGGVSFLCERVLIMINRGRVFKGAIKGKKDAIIVNRT